MEFSLAVIPSIVLLIFIYKNDRKEKEPMALLMKLFVYGVIVSYPVSFAEEIVSLPIDSLTTKGSFPYAILTAFVVAALCEEVGKFIVMRYLVWKDRNFNCTFDGIAYAVFVSLGFATLENILYVAEGGISTALVRMFVSVPGHMCFGVFMGYFFSKAKVADFSGDKSGYGKNIKRTLIVPIFLHGFYDCMLMLEGEIAGELTQAFAILIWYMFIIVLFIATFILVKIASREDIYFAPAVGKDWISKFGTK